MKLRQLLPSWLRPKTRRPHTKGPARSVRPRLECLEDRTVPTVVFNPRFGAETLVSGAPYTTLSSPTVYLIFWGSYWSTTAGRENANALGSAAGIILGSTYLNGLTEYGSNGRAVFGAQWIDPRSAASDPPAGFNAGNPASAAAIQNEIVYAINDVTSPVYAPTFHTDITHAPVYVVVTDPNHAGSNGGYNVGGTYTTTSTPINMISVGTGSGSMADSFGLTFSHEMAERMSDPIDAGSSHGVLVHPPSGLPLSLNSEYTLDGSGHYVHTYSSTQIGDNEPEPGGQPHYGYRFNGVLVQPYWSNTFQAFIVPDGNSQRFNLAPNWHVATATFDGTYTLTVNGDQLANHDDIITVDSVGGGVRVTLNGQVAQFNPGVITDIEVRSGSGNDVINVLSTPSGVSLNINSTGAAIVNIGNNGSLAGIQGSEITVSNPNSSTGVAIDDRNRGGTQTATFDTITSGGVQFVHLAGSIIPGGIYTQFASSRDVVLYTGTGAVTVNVLATGGHGLNLHGNSANTTVNVGNNGSLAGIQALEMTISNTTGNTGVVLDDRNRGGAQTATFDTITSGGLQFVHLAGSIIPGGIYTQFASSRDVDLYTGTDAVTVNVLASGGHGLNLHGNSPNTIVNVGNAGRVSGIQGTVTVTGTGAAVLTVNDSADPTPNPNGAYLDTYTPAGDTVYGTITGLAPAAINYRASSVASVIVRGGTGGNNIFGVYSTPAGVQTDLYGNGGYNQFVVYADGGGGAGGPGINGPVGLHGNPSASAVNYAVYYDYSSPGGQTYTLTATSITRAGLTPVTYDSPMEMVLVTSHSGGNTVNVLSNAAGNSAYIDVAPGDQVTIGSTAPTLGGTLSTIHGTVGVVGNDPAFNVSVTIDDSGNTGADARDVTFLQPYISLGETEIDIHGLTADPGTVFSYDVSASASVTVLGGAGNTTYHLQDFLAAVPLTLNAGGGTNTLDYSAATGNVYVNLQTGVATDLAGFGNVRNVVGASGGPAGSYNILVGNGGNVLTGGTGRSNFLIAGGSASTLIGGDSGDILVAGTTDYDTDAASLQAIMAYWTGPDDYATRVANLESGNGVPLLNAPATVHDNGGGNTVISNGLLDLIFANLGANPDTLG